MSDKEKPIIALAAGGTGGHIFPAVALARELEKRGYRPILFTDKRYLSYGVQKYNLENEILPLSHFSSNIFGKIKGALQLGISFLKALYLLKKYNIKCVVGFGGYPSFPTMMAAQLLGIKNAIHEQNSIIGRANKKLCEKTSAIAVSYQNTSGIPNKYKNKIYHTGNPIRPEIQALKMLPYPDFTDHSKLHILITGGSQGAKIFSKIIPQSIKLLPIEFRRRVRIDQQCRQNDFEVVKRMYTELDVDAELSAFFSDMPNRLASAHLVICRSGASSLSEAAGAGRPTIMVPLPTSKDNHQYYNATAFEELGAGIVMVQDSFTPENLAFKLENFFRAPTLLLDYAKNAHASGIIDADKKLADLVRDLLQGDNLTYLS